MFNEKSISPVVATALLLVLAVIVTVSFQDWLNTYQSAINTDAEQKSQIDSQIRVDGIMGNDLYIYSGTNATLNTLKVNDNKGNEVCNIVLSNGTNNIQNGLAGHWKLDNNSDIGENSTRAVDLSGNNNHAKIVDAVYNDSGKIDGAYSFHNETYNYILINDSPSLRVNNFTLSFWIYKKEEPLISVYLSKQYGSSTGNSFALYEKTGTYRFYGYAGGTTVGEYDSGYPIPFNTWTHLSATYNSSHLIMYANGTQVGVTGMNGLVDYDNAPILIGADDDSGSENYEFFPHALIDDVRIYNRTLGDSEITQLYNYRGSNKKTLNSGTNTLDLSDCSLAPGQAYNVVGFTDSQKVDMKVIAR